ncbi:MAG: hypothetical protein Q9163_001928 [Psora crenata]
MTSNSVMGLFASRRALPSTTFVTVEISHSKRGCQFLSPVIGILQAKMSAVPSSFSILWEKAIQQLSNDDRECIGFHATDRLDVLQDVLTAATSKRDVCMQKRWQYKKSNGDKVIVRDLLEKVLAWVNKFKAIGDIAVQYDQAHAVLPWASVRFLLQLNIDDVQIFGPMAEGLELVSRKIIHCRLIEREYMQHESAARDQLENALTRLYVAILKYLVKAKKYYGHGGWQQMLSSSFQTPETYDDILKIGKEVSDYTQLIDAEQVSSMSRTIDVVNNSIDTLRDDVRSLSARLPNLPIIRAAEHLDVVHDNLQKEDSARLLQWLSTVPYKKHHRASCDDLLQGSGLWLQRTAEFQEWTIASNSSLLWLHGIPGSGKTKLISAVIERILREVDSNLSTSPLAYFYVTKDAAEPQRSDPAEILRALVKQLCFSKGRLPELAIQRPVLQEYKKRLKEAEEDDLEPTKFSSSQCIDCILNLTEKNPAVLIIDAVDECNRSRRHELLAALKQIIERSKSLVKVLVSSREDANISQHLSGSPDVYIRTRSNSEDINRFVRLKVDEAIENKTLLNGWVSPKLKEHIIDTLIKRAEQIWASLQIQNLCDPESMQLEDDVMNALKQLPETISDLYKALFERINRLKPMGCVVAGDALRWLLCAQRPLSIDELVLAVTTTGTHRLTMEDILNLCCNLIVADVPSNRFRFAHASVREYFEDHPDFKINLNHTFAAGRCIQTLISHPQPSCAYGGEPMSNGYHRFSQYADRYWLVHYQNIQISERSHNLMPKVQNFFFAGTQISSRFVQWTFRVSSGSLLHEDLDDPLHDRDDPLYDGDDLLQAKLMSATSSPPTPLFTMCAFGLLEILEELDPGRDWDHRNTYGATGLYLASRYGHADVVSFLLSQGVNKDAKTVVGETALHRSCGNGHTRIVQLLLDSGANIRKKDIDGWTALDWAIKGRYQAIIKLLVQHGGHSELIAKYGHEVCGYILMSRVALNEPGQSTSEDNRFDLRRILSRPTNYLGIKDDGGTGFLNNTVLLLYIIRPLREVLHEVSESHDVDSESSVFALNSLFEKLRNSQDVASTQDLYRTFGWESFVPHPIATLTYLIPHLRGILASTFVGGAIERLFYATFNEEDACDSQGLIRIVVESYEEGNLVNILHRPHGHFQILRRVSRLPPILIVDIRRHIDASVAYGTVKASTRIRKSLDPLFSAYRLFQSHHYVGFPPQFTMQENETESIQTIVHRGDTEGGRFLSFLKPQRDGHWIRFQNDLVTFATAKEAMEDNFGTVTRPPNPEVSTTAVGLMYLRESMLEELLDPYKPVESNNRQNEPEGGICCCGVP